MERDLNLSKNYDCYIKHVKKIFVNALLYL